MLVSHMFPRKVFMADDVQLVGGGSGIIATIERVYPKEVKFDGGGDEPDAKWLLKLREIRQPMNLNRSNAQSIAQSTGVHDTEQWVGMKVILMTTHYNFGGKELHGITIFPARPDDKPTLGVNTDIIKLGRQKSEERRQLGSADAYHANRGAPPAGEKLGGERAAKIIQHLRVRGKTWDDLVAHFREFGIGQQIAGMIPPECPASIASPAWNYLKGFPEVRADGGEKELASIRAMWEPPTPNPRAGEVIDKSTGEVLSPGGGSGGDADGIDEDDIPF